MFYIFDLASHDAFGPFLTREKAHHYATLRTIGAYQVVSDNRMQNMCEVGSLHLVPAEYR